jgi:hypothetical protein
LPLTIALNGTGTAQLAQLSASPASLSFGSVAVGSTGTQTVTLSNTGNSSVSVSGINLAGTPFTVTGPAMPVTLSAGQTTTFSVVFAPVIAGDQTDAVKILSTATNSSITVPVQGAGVAARSRSALVRWDASSSPVKGYFVYRSTQAGGPYGRLNATPIIAQTYTDPDVQTGRSYFFVVTAVDDTDESGFSEEVSVTIPFLLADGLLPSLKLLTNVFVK